MKGELIDAEEGCKVLSLPDGAKFPIAYLRREDFTGANKILVRPCTQHLRELFCWIRDRNKLANHIQRGMIVKGPPGDGKVISINFCLIMYHELSNYLQTTPIYCAVFFLTIFPVVLS